MPNNTPVNNGLIKKKHLDSVFTILQNTDKFNYYLSFFKEKEPDYYNWAITSATNISTMFGMNNDLTIKEGKQLNDILVSTLFVGPILRMEMGSSIIDKAIIEENKEEEWKKEFNEFMNGRFPDKFYKYSTKKISPESCFVKAKENHATLKEKLNARANRSVK